MRRLKASLIPAAILTLLALSLTAFSAAAVTRTHATPSQPARRIRAGAAAVPILLYHHIAPVPKHVRNPAIYVPVSTFKRQISALAAAGFQAITLDQLTSAWQGQTPLPGKPVVITFDDGYADQATAAAPILHTRGWPAVLYLAPQSTLPGRISQSQVSGLIASGWQLAAHTITHPDLTKIPRAQLARQITGSRTLLNATYSVEVTAFAYPYGHLNTAVESAVRTAGFATATTTKSGLASADQDPLRLPRIIVTSHTTPAALIDKASGR